MTIMVGETRDLVAGRYRLAVLAGQGGVGRVWRGHEELPDREMAVTEIPPPDGVTPKQRHELAECAMRETREFTWQIAARTLVRDLATTPSMSVRRDASQFAVSIDALA